MDRITFFHVSKGLPERKNFHQNFFQKAFRTLRKSFQTFGVLLIGRAFNRSISFCQRNFVTRNNCFQVNGRAIKNFWPPTVSFLEFWRRRLAGFLEFNYSCQENFCEKTFVSQKFLLSLLGHWANNLQNFVLFCSAGPSKKQPMCPEVLCDEKILFQRKVFL